MLARTEKSPYAVEKKHLKLKSRNNMFKVSQQSFFKFKFWSPQARKFVGQEEETNKSSAMRNMISAESKLQIEQARLASLSTVILECRASNVLPKSSIRDVQGLIGCHFLESII